MPASTSIMIPTRVRSKPSIDAKILAHPNSSPHHQSGIRKSKMPLRIFFAFFRIGFSNNVSGIKRIASDPQQWIPEGILWDRWCNIGRIWHAENCLFEEQEGMHWQVANIVRWTLSILLREHLTDLPCYRSTMWLMLSLMIWQRAVAPAMCAKGADAKFGNKTLVARIWLTQCMHEFPVLSRAGAQHGINTSAWMSACVNDGCNMPGFHAVMSATKLSLSPHTFARILHTSLCKFASSGPPCTKPFKFSIFVCATSKK